MKPERRFCLSGLYFTRMPAPEPQHHESVMIDMNIQVYFLKKNFDVQKAERWFKERRIAYQSVDLRRAKLGPRELGSIAAKVGVGALINRTCGAYAKSPLPNLRSEEAKLEALLSDPALLVTPIVRNGKEATVGFRPDVWETWK